MTEFKKFLTTQPHNKALFDSSVTVTYEGTTLHLRFDNKDIITAATYEGSPDVWMSSMCELLTNMPLSEARFVDMSHWELVWKQDQFFWDMKLEMEDRLFFMPTELLHAALDMYRGREYLYKEESPLICRCMGVREKDVVAYLNTAKDPSFEDLSKTTKAGMGCRSCVPQLKKWLLVTPETKSRQYKSRPVADWIEAIDNALARFPESSSWKMNVESMKGNVVMISYDFKVTQREEEEMAKKLQGFLAGATDLDLAFFLTRALQR
ncbi:MAG: (2Fe-2S)-binding protein [Bdellovibrionota bacterium]